MLGLSENGIATEDELSEIDKNAKKQVREGKKNAWDAFITPIKTRKKYSCNAITIDH